MMPHKKERKLQAILFDKSKWSAKKARSWLRKHDYIPMRRVEQKPKYLKYHLRDPDDFKRLRTISLSKPECIKALYGKLIEDEPDEPALISLDEDFLPKPKSEEKKDDSSEENKQEEKAEILEAKIDSEEEKPIIQEAVELKSEIKPILKKPKPKPKPKQKLNKAKPKKVKFKAKASKFKSKSK